MYTLAVKARQHPSSLLVSNPFELFTCELFTSFEQQYSIRQVQPKFHLSHLSRIFQILLMAIDRTAVLLLIVFFVVVRLSL